MKTLFFLFILIIQSVVYASEPSNLCIRTEKEITSLKISDQKEEAYKRLFFDDQLSTEKKIDLFTQLYFESYLDIHPEKLQKFLKDRLNNLNLQPSHLLKQRPSKNQINIPTETYRVPILRTLNIIREVERLTQPDPFLFHLIDIANPIKFPALNHLYVKISRLADLEWEYFHLISAILRGRHEDFGEMTKLLVESWEQNYTEAQFNQQVVILIKALEEFGEIGGFNNVAEYRAFKMNKAGWPKSLLEDVLTKVLFYGPVVIVLNNLPEPDQE